MHVKFWGEKYHVCEQIIERVGEGVENESTHYGP